MSEKIPESQPVLALRSAKDGVRRIEVWNTTDKVDEQGRRYIESQVPEEKDGKLGLVGKFVPEQALSAEVQAAMAHDLAMDRSPMPEQLERNPLAKKAVEDLGEQALGIIGVESPDKDENKPEVDAESAIKSFEERISYIEESARSQMDGYKHLETETLDLLIRKSSTVAEQLVEAQLLLRRAADGAYGYNVAFSRIEDSLHSIQNLLRSEAGEVSHISDDTEKANRGIDSQKNGELVHQKRNFIAATGIEDGDAFYAANTLDKHLGVALESLGAVKIAIRAAEGANEDQQAAVKRLIGFIDMMRPAVNSGRLSTDDIGGFEHTLRRLIGEMGDDAGSHLKKIRNSIDAVGA